MNRLKRGLLAVSCICCVTLTTGCSVTETMDKIMGKTNEAATKGVEVQKETDGKVVSDFVSAPEFVKNLEGTVTYTLGAPAEALQVEAVSPDEGGAISYQWYRNNVDVNGGGDAIEGAVSASYIPDISTPGSTYYYVLVTNTVGSELQMTTSSLAEVVVLAAGGSAEEGESAIPAEGGEVPSEGETPTDEDPAQPSDPGE